MKNRIEYNDQFECDGNSYRFADLFGYRDDGKVEWLDSWGEKQVGDKWIKLGPEETGDIIDLWYEKVENNDF